MNIRGLAPTTAIDNNKGAVERIAETSMQLKPDVTSDRDANGQQFYQKQQKRKEPMTEEAFESAMKALREKDFVKEMNWVIVALEEGGLKYALVQDQAGKLIRKISEFDLWEVFDGAQTEPQRGNLLNKAA